MDASTLEQRLQIVTKRLVRKPQQASQVVSSSAVGNMIPTPGTTPSNMMPTPGTGSNMMSMPGNSSSMTLTPVSTGNLMLPGGGGGGGGSLSSMMSLPGNGNNSFMNPMSHGSGTMMPAPGTNISNMIPTPGHASNNMFVGVSGTNMMPTPGSAGMNSLGSSQQAAIGGGLRLSQNGLVASSMGMGVSNQMIPTPGLTSSQGMSISPAPSSAGLPDMSGVTSAQLQQYGGGGVNDHYRGLNGHLGGGSGGGGGISSSVQRKSTSSSIGLVNGGNSNELMLPNGQHLMNGNTVLHNPASYPNASQYSNVHLQHQQHPQRLTTQQQRPPNLRMRMFSPSLPPSLSLPLHGHVHTNATLCLAGSVIH